jgi:hypothetical protein
VPSAKQAFLSGFCPWIASKCDSHAYFLSEAANFLSIPVAWVAKKYADSCYEILTNALDCLIYDLQPGLVQSRKRLWN